MFFRCFVLMSVIAVLIVNGYRSSLSTCQRKFCFIVKSDLERELDLFLEQTSNAGSQNIMKLTAQQRAQRAIIGSEIEDKLFALREDLEFLESDGLRSGNIDMEAIKKIRDSIVQLKDQYTEIVGAKDLPIYFGKIPDSLQ